MSSPRRFRPLRVERDWLLSRPGEPVWTVWKQERAGMSRAIFYGPFNKAVAHAHALTARPPTPEVPC